MTQSENEGKIRPRFSNDGLRRPQVKWSKMLKERLMGPQQPMPLGFERCRSPSDLG